MPKEYRGLPDFVAKIRTEFMPRSDRFEVKFTFPPGVELPPGVENEIVLFCEEAQIPGLSTSVKELRLGAWTEFRSTNLEFLTQDSVFTFLADEDWSIRAAFENWMFLCSNPNSKELGWATDYYGSVEISSLKPTKSKDEAVSKHEVIGRWVLHECFPKIISLSPFAMNNTTVMRVSVTMSANRWERIEI